MSQLNNKEPRFSSSVLAAHDIPKSPKSCSSYSHNHPEGHSPVSLGALAGDSLTKYNIKKFSTKVVFTKVDYNSFIPTQLSSSTASTLNIARGTADPGY